MIRWLPPLGYMALLLMLSSIPANDTATNDLEAALLWTPPAVQNLLHVPVYGLLACLWWRALGDIAGRAWLTLLLAGGWGLVDEWYQISVPGRYASVSDALLDLAGVVLMVGWLRHRERQPKAATYR